MQPFYIHCSMLTPHKHDDADHDANACTGQTDQRTPSTPSHIPLYGWWGVLWCSAWRMSEDRLFGETAAVAFYSLLAVFPALAALISLFGLVADPAAVADRLRTLAATLPAGAAEMVSDELRSVAARTGGHLGLGAGLAAAALWSAMAAAGQLFGALNIIYCEQESRSFLRFNLTSLLFAFGAAVFILLSLGALAAVPMMTGTLFGAGTREDQLLRLLHWPVLLVAVSAVLACTYRYGPSRAPPNWRWVSWGGAVGAVTWLLGSAAISWYFEHIGNYGWLYGSLGTVLGFMTWAWFSSAAVLFGATLNAEIEQWKWPAQPTKQQPRCP